MTRKVAAIAIVLAIVLSAGAVDRHWHQMHCLNSVRSTRLVNVGSHELGVAEYSWRHLIANAPWLPDMRDVRICLGPAGQFQLSRIVVWCTAFCAATVGVNLIMPRPMCGR